MKRLLMIAALTLWLAGCGSDATPQGEDYGNLFNSPDGLVLVAEEHPTGWMRPDCFACHQVRNIHTVNRSGISDADLAEVRRIVDLEGEASCSLCHGDNGVQP